MSQQIRDSMLAKYINLIFDSFMELRGDRKLSDDPGILAGLARLDKHKVVIVAYGINEFPPKSGIACPDGYRKAQRLMNLANTFRKPFIVFIDVPEYGSSPTIQQQHRDESVARNLEIISFLAVPTIAIVTGRRNSSLAIDLCGVDRVFMFENSICCIPYIQKKQTGDSEPLCLKAQHLHDLGIVDRIIASDNMESEAKMLRDSISGELYELSQINIDEVIQKRLNKLQSLFCAFGSLESLPE